MAFIIPDDTGPGPTTLIGGSATAGFFGEVPTNELITGSGLASLIDLTGGDAQNDTSPWLKFVLDGRILFVAKKSYRYNLSWDHINAANAVFGNKLVEINGYQFRVSLLKGLNPDPSVVYTIGYDVPSGYDSEWNRLMYHVAIDIPSFPKTSQVGPNWANYPQDDSTDGLDISIGNGPFSWCQETVPDQPTMRVRRGSSSVSYLSHGTSSFAYANWGWRPVLEFTSLPPISVEALPVVDENKRLLKLTYTTPAGPETQLCSGYVKFGDIVAASFVDCPEGIIPLTPESPIFSDMIDGSVYRMPGLLNIPVTVEIYSPFNFSTEIPFGRELDIAADENLHLSKWIRDISKAHPNLNIGKFSAFIHDINNAYGMRFDSRGIFKDNKVREDIRAFFLDEANIEDFFNPNTGPGSQELIGSNETAGFYGEVPVNELISGSELASMIGLTAGTVQYDTSPWLKFVIDDEIIFVAKKSYRNGISWDNINAANAVDGSRIVTIKGYKFKVSLPKGLNPDTSVPFTTGIDVSSGYDSEWNRLMYHVAIDNPSLPKTSQVGPNWANYPQDDSTDGLACAGTYNWCQEISLYGPTHKVMRGGEAVSGLGTDTSSFATYGYGWRPVLRLIL